ncbi:hypothetical protein FQN54_004894 [Arachnomyces sp. PD_36]|nr:hypothetical protein FQN54_004894 [Arachnomyces sp. PD_36]
MDFIPREIFELIVQHLPNADRKNLRLTSREVHERVPFRIERVFLSPSYKNIEVFRAILADDHWRKQVQEIIWDDAKFSQPASGTFLCGCEDYEVEWDGEEETEEMARARLRKIYPTLLSCALTTPATWHWVPQKETVVSDHLEYADNKDFSRWFPVGNADALPTEENNEINRRLAVEQIDIVNAGTDRELFRAGLTSFPALKRVVVTSTMHRMFPFLHEYDSPLLRSLPKGFRMRGPDDWNPLISRYDDADYDKVCCWVWRGFNIVVEELNNLHGQHNVSELLINPSRKPVGVNQKLLDRPDNPPVMYSTLYQLFQSVQLTRLELSLRVAEFLRDWGFLRNGLLKSALEQLTELQVFSLHTTTETNIDVREFYTEKDATALADYLPVQAWPHLQSLTLARLIVLEDDLLNFIRSLPSHVDEINLETIRIYKGDWRSLYAQVKEDIALGYHPQSPRFRFSAQQQTTSRYIRIDDELHEFLYRSGPNPFDGDLPPHRIQFGFGVVIDEYDKSYQERYLPPKWFRNVGPGRWVDLPWENEELTPSLDITSLLNSKRLICRSG